MKDFELLSGTFLFSGIDRETLSRLLLENPPLRKNYVKGEMIYSSVSEGRLLGFVLSGSCEVRRLRSDGGHLILNTLSPGDSFGILSVFSEDDFPTSVYASRSCKLLFFTDRQIEAFILASPGISNNIIRFLASRVSFLNSKIATFSGSRVEDRLAAYLICRSRELDSMSFPFSYSRCGEQINAGRASVYRAVNALCEAGLISVSEKQVNILDPKGLGGIGSI